MIMSFNDYQDKSILESIKKIKILHKVLNLLSIKNKVFLDGQDPYIYVKCFLHNSEIKGIRIYPIANKIAFKIQNQPKELPQGRPYLLDFEKVYGDIIDIYEKSKKNKEKNKEIKAAEEVAKQFLETLKQFFRKKDKTNFDVVGKQIAPISLGTDYSSSIYSKY